MNSDVPEIDADGVIDRLRQAVGVRTDVALSLHFGRSKNVVSAWRARQTVPYAECALVAMHRGLSLDWLVLGIGKGPAPPDGDGGDAMHYGDPRVARMVGFVERWQGTHDSDDVAWLERTLARTVPEYAEWMTSHSMD